MQVHRKFLAEPWQLDMDEIRSAALSGEPVGSCDCGSYLHVEGLPASGWAGRGPLWVMLACRACGRDIAAPDGRLTQRWRRGGAA